MSGTGILSGTPSEKARKTLERLVAEVRDASEEFGLDCVRLKMLRRSSACRKTALGRRRKS